jgi:hypothetical protein
VNVQRRAKRGRDRASLQPFLHPCRDVLDGGARCGSPVSDHQRPDLAGGIHGPGADDLAVPPQGGPDVALVVEDMVLRDAEEPVASFPAHGGGVESGQQHGGRRVRRIVEIVVDEGNAGVAVQVHVLDRKLAEHVPDSGLVPAGPPPQVVDRGRPEPGEPAPGQFSLRVFCGQFGQAVMPPAFDGFPAVVATGPRAGRGGADDAALGTHHGEQGRGDVLRAVRGRAGRNVGPQRRDVGGQLGASGTAPGTQGVLDLSLQAGKPRFQVTADGRLRAVALQLANQAPAQHGGEWGADRGLHDRDVGTAQEEQGAPHGHPAYEAAPLVHRRRHIGQARCGAAGEYREVDRGRVGGMQRDQGVSHRFRVRSAAVEVVPAHHGVTPLLHRDGSQAVTGR